ncbi:40-kDa huntingtin-associated protein-like [Cylas formicarius]|uniref:40-kDa huntingtin-associated protein-like n=1 Tax=Cylas formicarius TaxID=197179 RepID=UPI0029589D6C|nr:40-kDa huntingtin-associated protein-like [Cylas formicarius]
MSTETTGHEILDRYRVISGKLKKRFLRKPNVTEASESFVKLGQQCESQDLPSYAALSWMAAARCEGSLGNIPGETSYMIRSARQFLNAEEKDFSTGCVRVPSDNLQAGLSCFNHAAIRCPEECTIPVGLELEIVEFLKRIDRNEYIETYIRNSVEISEGRPKAKIHSLDLLGSHFISSGDYVAALKSYLEVSDTLCQFHDSGYKSELLLKCEVNCVFLLLILHPVPQKLSPKLGKILEKYAWGDKNDKSIESCHMSEKMFLLLQSLVIMCQSFDTNGLTELEGEFWPLLSNEQKDLLRLLVGTYQL